MEKVQVKAYIPKELNDKLREFISKTYPYKGSQLSKVLKSAIESYLRTQSTQQHYTRNVQNRNSKVIDNWNRVKDFLIRNEHVADLPRGKFIPDSILRIAIENINGIDKRTVDGWSEKFIKHGIIGKTGIHQYQVLWSEDYQFETEIEKEMEVNK